MSDDTLKANPEDRPAQAGSAPVAAPDAEAAPAAPTSGQHGEVEPAPAPQDSTPQDSEPQEPAPPEPAPQDPLAAGPAAADVGAAAPQAPGLRAAGLTTAHTRPIRASSATGDRRPAWSGFLLGVVVLVIAIGLAWLLWQYAGDSERTADAPADLMEIETLLDQLGFPPGAVDGTIDAESTAAIRDFQATAGLDVDGVPSPGLLEELLAAQAEISGGG